MLRTTEDEARRVRIIDLLHDVPPSLADQTSFPDWLAPEIERLQQAATKKRASKDAANSFFKS